MRTVVQNRPHQRQSPRKGVVQLDHVGHTHVGKRGLHLLTGDPVVADEKLNIRHVLRIVAPHHLRENEIDRVGAEELQMPGRRAKNRKNVLVPVGAEENEVLREQMRDVKTARLEKLICSFHRIPEFPIGIKFLKLTYSEDRVDILSSPMGLINSLESEADCRPAVENKRSCFRQFFIKSGKNLRRIVSKQTHPATTFTGRIHCITVSRPFLVKPVIATNLVMWGSRSGLGASKSGSNFSNLRQKGLSGSTLFPRLAI